MIATIINGLFGWPIIAISIFAVSYYYYRKYRGIPPGPTGVPLLGYGPFFGKNPPQKFLQLKEKYGKIFSISMGPQLGIVLNDYEAIREAFIDKHEIFHGRPSSFIFSHISRGEDGKLHGLGLQEGDEWKSSRRFILQTFRDLGMGKSSLQNRILEEAEYLTEIFKQKLGEPFNPDDHLYAAVSNIICTLCFGRRFDHDNPRFVYILRQLREFALGLAQAGPMQAYPFLRFIPGPIANLWKRFMQIFSDIVLFLKELIDETKEEHVGKSADEVASFVDAFTVQQEKVGSKSTVFSDDDLLVNIQGLFGAGTETTSVTLLWSLLFMMHHPDVQAKVHEEIDQQVGRERSITIDDKAKLPYLEAVIREVQRHGNVTPLGVVRSNREESTVLGYRIPKRSLILPNFISVNMDPKLWKDPLEFRPERFINKQGALEEPPYFMPFSIGKRACVGESLARMELFLFFANIMQRFQIKQPSGYYLPATSECISGISSRPLPYLMEVIAR